MDDSKRDSDESVGISETAAPSVGPKADDLDQPPSKVADQAPWTGNHRPPAPLQ